MRNPKQFIAINRFLMTSREMADELGVPILKVNNILSKNKWTAISVSDRIRDYLIANPEATNKEVAEKFDRTIQLVNLIEKKLKEQGYEAPVTSEEQEKATPEQPKPYVNAFDWAKEEGYGAVLIPRKDRIKEAYTQSSSPFGFADELRKIKTRG